MQAQAKSVVSSLIRVIVLVCTHDVHSAGLSVSAIPVALTRSLPARLKAFSTVQQPCIYFSQMTPGARLPVLILIYPLAVRTRLV